MADEEKKVEKKTALSEFREKIRGDKEKIREVVTEGLKHTNAKVRSLAIKTAFKMKDHEFVKKHVLPLVNNDVSKKVLRTMHEKISRKPIAEKLKKWVAPKPKAKAADVAPATGETKA